MAYKERHNEILKILAKLKQASVSGLTERLKVSEVTIRKDLSLLEEQGKLLRTHGGAVLAEDRDRLRTLTMRTGKGIKEKREIALRAREMIREDDTIYIDAGTTCYYLAEEIKKMNLRVVTSSLAVMVELSSCPEISLFSLGGSFREEAGSFIGPAAEKALKGFQIETCFLGTTGISYDGKFSSQNTIEAQLKRSVLAACRRRIILADHSKYGETAFSIFAHAADIDVLIMDSASVDISKLKVMDFELVLV